MKDVGGYFTKYNEHELLLVSLLLLYIFLSVGEKIMWKKA